MTLPEKSIHPTQESSSVTRHELEFLAVGKLRRPHGVQGEMLMEVMTDFPERLQKGVRVFLGDNHRDVVIRRCRSQDQGLLIAFEDYATPEAVAELRNTLVYVRADDRPPLPDGEYYYHQLLGLAVVTDQGQPLGQLHEILSTGANDVYVVRPESGPEILLPAIASVILEVDLAQRQIKVHLLPGLLPD